MDFLTHFTTTNGVKLIVVAAGYRYLIPICYYLLTLKPGAVKYRRNDVTIAYPYRKLSLSASVLLNWSFRYPIMALSILSIFNGN